MPTRKWWASTVTGAGTLAVAWINAGFTHTVEIALVGLVIQRAVAYITPNAEVGP